MRSVILISPSEKEMQHLYQQWKEKATIIYENSENLSIVMVIDEERIYVYYCGDEADYEEGELTDVDISTPTFYLICYSDRDIMKHFIVNSNFCEGSYMDNDHGRIIRVDELRKEEILDFIE